MRVGAFPVPSRFELFRSYARPPASACILAVVWRYSCSFGTLSCARHVPGCPALPAFRKRLPSSLTSGRPIGVGCGPCLCSCCGGLRPVWAGSDPGPPGRFCPPLPGGGSGLPWPPCPPLLVAAALRLSLPSRGFALRRRTFSFCRRLRLCSAAGHESRSRPSCTSTLRPGKGHGLRTESCSSLGAAGVPARGAGASLRRCGVPVAGEPALRVPALARLRRVSRGISGRSAWCGHGASRRRTAPALRVAAGLAGVAGAACDGRASGVAGMAGAWLCGRHLGAWGRCRCCGWPQVSCAGGFSASAFRGGAPALPWVWATGPTLARGTSAAGIFVLTLDYVAFE